MKKILLIVMTMALSLGLLYGCSKKEPVNAPTSDEKVQPQKEPEKKPEDTQETEKEEEQEAVSEEKKQLLANNIDYLSAEGIQVPEGAVIAMVGKDSKSSYWKQLKKGAEAAIADLNAALSYTGNKKVQLLYDAPENEDIEEQVDIIDQLLDKNPTVLCVSFVDSQSGRTQLELADANGVPVLAMDSGVENDLIRCDVQTDNLMAGVEASMRFFAEIGRTGKIAVLVQSETSESGIDRASGVSGAIALQSAYPGVQLAEVIYMQKDDARTLEEIQRVVSENPDLTGILATNQKTTEFLLNVWDEVQPAEGQEVKLAGFDAGEKILEALENGSLAGTMVQDPYTMGYATVIASAREAADMENAAQVFTDCCWVNLDNLEEADIQAVIYE
ncbi:MAG: substrate-binding domain-containing protein [Lachnospiraceae bacterium]|nr:substrate-binding domain-containing protein [Lachnospiraceae bacterium]